MGKILVIAEKPSVGRDIAKVLKCTKKAEGYLYNDEYIVSWAVGHLVALYDPEDYDPAFKKWRYETLPIIPEEIKLKPIKNTQAQLVILKKLMKDKEVDSFVCATDSGREGELIFRYIYNIIKSKKPFKRLWISSMTDEAITEGFNAMKDGEEYNNLYLSAKCRSEADWLVGINASRAFTIQYNALLSIGRVQTPTLAILVERQKEINAFKPDDYWEVIAAFEKGYKGKWFEETSGETKITTAEKAEEIVNKVKGQAGFIKSVEKEEKKQPPPLLYDLTELQRDCNKKFGFSASKTLSIAQDLYEKRKMITYPRTDSRYLSDDMVGKIGFVLKKLNIPPYDRFVKYVLELDKLPITKRIVDNSKISDHHAIIPTGSGLNLNGLSGDELKVFDLVAKRFICVFYPSYVYSVTKIITDVLSELFMTKGTVVINYGYMELYKDDKPEGRKKKDETDDEAVLPDVVEQEQTTVSDALSERKKTKPPKPYNEASLLSAMENAGRFIEDEDLKEQLKDSGLGTPATRAAIIERIIKVGYVERKGKNLIPTEKGMKLIEIVPKELKSPETTGKWERGLSSVAKGTMDDKRFMASINRYVHYIVGQSAGVRGDVIFEEEKRSYNGKSKALGTCPLCNTGEIFENSKSFFCGRWKSGCKFSIWKDSVVRYGVELNASMIKKLLRDKKIENVSMALPQTREKCLADLVLKEGGAGLIEFINLNRLKDETTKNETTTDEKATDDNAIDNKATDVLDSEE